MIIRKYGKPPYKVVVVHGGPGAPGELKPLALTLAASYGVLEPWQTAKTINGQVAELKTVIETRAERPVILIGWSWGAWLSFITAAKNPALIKKLILISSGPFKAAYATRIMPTRLSRLSSRDKIKAETLLSLITKKESAGSKAQLAEFGALMAKADAYNPLPVSAETEKIAVQPSSYRSVWQEAAALRQSGQLLRYGRKIKCPVTVIHREYDPAPHEGISKPLSEVLKDFKFILLPKCGHHPWLEKDAREDFYKVLTREIRYSH